MRAAAGVLLATTSLFGACGTKGPATSGGPVPPYARVVTCLRLTDAVFTPSAEGAGTFTFSSPEGSMGGVVVMAHGPAAARLVDRVAARLPSGGGDEPDASRGTIVYRMIGPLVRRGA